MIQPDLKAYRRCSDRHVLVLETNLTYVEKCQIFHYADLVRKAGNELTGIMKKRYDQLVRTKRYRKLKRLYKKYKDTDNKKALKDVCNQMKEMQKQYDVTWDYCRTSMIPIGKKYGINAQINGNNELVLPTNNVVELNRTLEFLNEDIFRGIITDSLYRSNSKKKDNR